MQTTTTSLAANPFLLLLNPEAVFDAINRSEMLEGLARRVCYPLDRISVPAQTEEATSAAAAEGAIPVTV